MSRPDEFDRVFSIMKYNKADMIRWIREFFDMDHPEGTSYYFMTRVKSAWAAGTVTTDDFVELDDLTIEYLAQHVLEMLTSPTPPETYEKD